MERTVNSMKPSLIVYTIVCVFGISCGQLLFKKAASTTNTFFSWHALASNLWLWSAFTLYGLMTLLWVWILKQAPLHLAYPFMGLAFLLVPVFARIFLNEPLSPQTIGGGILIMLGIALASAGAHH